MAGVHSITLSRYSALEKDYLFTKQRLGIIPPLFNLKRKKLFEKESKIEQKEELFAPENINNLTEEYIIKLEVESEQNEDAFWFKQKNKIKKVVGKY